MPGAAQVNIQRDEPTELDHVRIPAANIRGLHLRPSPVSVFPEEFVVNQRYVNSVPIDYQPFYSITPANTSGVIGATLPNTWLLNRHPASAVAAIRNKLVLSAGAGANPSSITIDGAEYVLQPIPGLQHQFEVLEYTVGEYTAGSVYRVWIQGATATFPPAVRYEIGDWIADTTSSLVPDPDGVAGFARAGNTELKVPYRLLPPLGLTELIDGAATGFTYTGGNVFGPFIPFPTEFDLDAAANEHGFLELSGVLRFATRGDSSLGWGAARDAEYRFAFFASLADIRATADFVAGRANGVKFGEVQARRTAGLVSTNALYVTHNAAGQPGYQWVVTAADAGVNFGASATLTAGVNRQLSGGTGGGGAALPAASFDDTTRNDNTLTTWQSVGSVTITTTKTADIWIDGLGGWLRTSSSQGAVGIARASGFGADDIVQQATLSANLSHYLQFSALDRARPAGTHTYYLGYRVYDATPNSGLRTGADSPIIMRAQEVSVG